MIRKRKITAIRQRDSMHCGVTCLAMICRYYGSMVNGHVAVSFPADTDVAIIARFVRKMGKEVGHVGP